VSAIVGTRTQARGSVRPAGSGELLLGQRRRVEQLRAARYLRSDLLVWRHSPHAASRARDGSTASICAAGYHHQADGVLPALLEGVLDSDGIRQRTILAAEGVGRRTLRSADRMSRHVYVHARRRAAAP